MRRVLIVHAHPEPASFCSSLQRTAVEHFSAQGHEVRMRDLYAIHFNPIGGRADFTTTHDPDYFKYQAEQVQAHRQGHFADDLRTEMEHFLWCDLLIFSFPLWWFGLPAILKGWVDRVFAMGFSYGDGKGVYAQGTFKEKMALLTFTTGGPEISYQNGRNGDLDTILFPIHHGMLYFVGMKVLPPFVSFGPARITQEERLAELARYRAYLDGLDGMPAIYGG